MKLRQFRKNNIRPFFPQMKNQIIRIIHLKRRNVISIFFIKLSRSMTSGLMFVTLLKWQGVPPWYYKNIPPLQKICNKIWLQQDKMKIAKKYIHKEIFKSGLYPPLLLGTETSSCLTSFIKNCDPCKQPTISFIIVLVLPYLVFSLIPCTFAVTKYPPQYSSFPTLPPFHPS